MVTIWDETIESQSNWLPGGKPASWVRKQLKEMLEELMIHSEKTWLALSAATKNCLPAAGRVAGQQTKDYDSELLGHRLKEKDYRFRCRLRSAS